MPISLGVLDEQGLPLNEMGILASPLSKAGQGSGSTPGQPVAAELSAGPGTMAGKPCPECGNHTLIHKDGCEFCTACGYVGQCG